MARTAVSGVSPADRLGPQLAPLSVVYCEPQESLKSLSATRKLLEDGESSLKPPQLLPVLEQYGASNFQKRRLQ